MLKTEEWWGRLSGGWKALIVVTAVFGAGFSSNVVAERFIEAPDRLDDLEEAVGKQVNNFQQEHQEIWEEIRRLDDESRQRFIYIGCSLEAIKNGSVGERCWVVLSAEDRRLLEQLIRGAL